MRSYSHEVSPIQLPKHDSNTDKPYVCWCGRGKAPFLTIDQELQATKNCWKKEKQYSSGKCTQITFIVPSDLPWRQTEQIVIMHLETNKQTKTHIYTHLHTYTCLHTYIHEYTYICLHTHTHTNTRMVATSKEKQTINLRGQGVDTWEGRNEKENEVIILKINKRHKVWWDTFGTKSSE